MVIRIIFFALFLLIVTAHFFDWLCPLILTAGCDVQYFDEKYSLGKIFLITVVIGPLIETALFQMLPYKLYNRLINKNNTTQLLFVVFSGILFGLIHSYNIITIIDGFISGVIFIYIYMKSYAYNKKAAFGVTFMVHSLYNLYAFVIDDVLKLS